MTDTLKTNNLVDEALVGGTEEGRDLILHAIVEGLARQHVETVKTRRAGASRGRTGGGSTILQASWAEDLMRDAVRRIETYDRIARYRRNQGDLDHAELYRRQAVSARLLSDLLTRLIPAWEEEGIQLARWSHRPERDAT